MFDLKVRLIPDGRLLRDELRKSQRDGIKGGVSRATQGATGVGVGTGIGGGASGGLKISGFGKIIGGVLGISAILTALKPIIEPVMKLLQALLMILFIPLIPIMKPLFLLLGELAKKLVPIMKDISDRVSKALEKSGFSAAFEVYFDEITEKVLVPGFIKLMEQVIPAVIPILVSGFISFIEAIVTTENIEEIGDALIKGFKNLAVTLFKVVLENWKSIVIGGLLLFVTSAFAVFLIAITGASAGWALIIGGIIIGALIYIAKKISDNWTEIWQIIKDAWDGFVNGLKNIFIDILNKIRNINPFSRDSSKNSETGNDFILRPNGSLIKTDPRDTIVGFRADKGASAMGAMGGGQTITLNINNPSIRSEADIRKLVNEISRILAAQGRRQFS